MKRLFVWLASVSICAAQAVTIGPFATEDWVEEKLSGIDTNAVNRLRDYVDAVSNSIPDVSGLATKSYVDAVSNAIPDTSMFSTVEYVNTTSNNLALLIDDLVSEEELGSSVSNIVPSWALVPIPPVTAEVDPAFTHWLATTNIVLFDSDVIGQDSLEEHDTPYVIFDNENLDKASGIYIDDNGNAAIYYNDAYNSMNPGANWRTCDLSSFVTGSEGFINIGGIYYDLSSFVTGSDGSINVSGTDYYLPSFVTHDGDSSIIVNGYEYNLSSFVTGSEGFINVGGIDYNLSSFVTGSEGFINVGGTDYYLPSFVTQSEGGFTVNGTMYYPSAFVTYAGNEIYVNDSAYSIDEFAKESIQLQPYYDTDYTAYTLRYEPSGSKTFYYDGENSTVGLFMMDSKGDPYISACNGQVAKYINPVFFDSMDGALEDIYGNQIHVCTAAFDAIAPAFIASNVYTNGDYVIYDMHLYECTNYTGQAGWRANDWKQTTVTDILGNLRRLLDAINGSSL